ncbi:Fur family transcriptional regulator [Kitasatospora sp. NPDC094015]|uniref:Fur family transcriptional regulator n=1 Tax=Kitasatospora sp. NPDC094015 TaxID=3155205 RepID=UPI00332B6F08
MQACLERLRAGGGRCTGPRVQVVRALVEHGGHASAGDLHRRIRDGGGSADQASVYRTLARLTELGITHAVPGLGGELHYGLGRRPHHHALCRKCGAIVDIPAQLVAAALAGAAALSGFALDALVMSGSCGSC